MCGLMNNHSSHAALFWKPLSVRLLKGSSLWLHVTLQPCGQCCTPLWQEAPSGSKCGFPETHTDPSASCMRPRSKIHHSLLSFSISYSSYSLSFQLDNPCVGSPVMSAWAVLLWDEAKNNHKKSTKTLVGHREATKRLPGEGSERRRGKSEGSIHS